VPELGASAETAAKKSIPSHDGAADSRTDREHCHVGHVATSAKSELGPTSSIGVIIDRDVDLDTISDALPERFVAPTDVRSVVDDGLAFIDKTGRSDTSGDDVFARREFVNHFHHGVDDGLWIAGRGGSPIFAENFTLVGHQGSRDFGSADVDSDRMHDS
jgi:hypothetical protein